MFKSLIIFVAILAQVCSFIVMTTRGPVVGQKAEDGNYKMFFGVPYAKVNEMKPFENTLEYPKFTTPFNASDPFVRCPQAITVVGGIIQCLRLNIYVPISLKNQPTTEYPVYVWFHGGGLAFGSAGEYNATHFVQKDIIVVTANYRLGPYGFLCTSMIENQGLKDMKTALKWIKNNIRAFGGDPDKVTIGGESWGASAVDFLLYDDADFHQAIMESGSRYSFSVSTRKDNVAPIKLASQLGFHTTDHKEAVTFLSKSDPIDVMQASKNLSMVFGVCESSGSFAKQNKIKTVPILVGYNSKEAFADFAKQPDTFYENIKEELLTNLEKLFVLPKDDIQNLGDIILRFYLGGKTVSRESMLELIDLSSDFRVNYGVERSVREYLKSGNPNVYKYIFSYTGGSPYLNMTGVGAYHTEELPYLFEWGRTFTNTEQQNMREGMTMMWTYFIKHGRPSPRGSTPTWAPSSLPGLPYLDINVEAKMRESVYHQRIAFWELMWTGLERYIK